MDTNLTRHRSIDPTKIGLTYPGGVGEELDVMFDRGLDPVALLAERVRSTGMKFHMAFRAGIQAWSPEPFLCSYTTPFYEAHPEWRCRDRDGTEIPAMSYAFPQVREYALSLIREAAENYIYLLNGVDIIFPRGPVFLLYEEPLLEGFKQFDRSNVQTNKTHE